MFVNSDVSYLRFVSAHHRKHFIVHIVRCAHFKAMHVAVADPDLQIMGKPGHPEPEIRVGRWSKSKGDWPPGTSPESVTAAYVWYANEFTPVRGAYVFLL